MESISPSLFNPGKALRPITRPYVEKLAVSSSSHKMMYSFGAITSGSVIEPMLDGSLKYKELMSK